jgi:hypothetical protein
LKKIARAGAALAAGSLVLGLTALPGGAQVPEPDVELTGVARCNLATGHETYTLEWTLTNNGESLIPNAVEGELGTQGLVTDLGAIEVLDAVETGAYEGTLEFDPEIVYPEGGTAEASDGPVPNQVGVVTAEVTYGWFWDEEVYVVEAEIVLDGTCTAPMPTTESTTTTTAAARPIQVRPAFTG